MPTIAASNDTSVSTILNAAGVFTTIEASLLKKAILDVLGGDTTSAYSLGTVYTLTTSLSPIVFGTTSPSITIPRDGTYSLQWYCAVDGVGATTAPTNVISIVPFRAGTPLGMSGINFNCPTATTSNETFGSFNGAPVIFPCVAGDVITLNARCTAAPAAGTLVASKAVILATRLY